MCKQTTKNEQTKGEESKERLHEGGDKLLIPNANKLMTLSVAEAEAGLRRCQCTSGGHWFLV